MSIAEGTEAMTLFEVRRSALRSLVPPPRLKLFDWIEKNLRLPAGVSALPGRVKLWPYQREIADAISDPEIERVSLIKAARLGFTTLLTGAIGAFVVNEPSPILALLPTEADCRDYMVSDVEPIFDASPALAGLLAADAEEGARNTLTARRFPGGSLKLVAARAPRNLRRHTARILIVDEADACEVTAEGNPLRLAERRTLSYANRKIIIGSTPLDEDTSNVLRAYGESDGRIFEVPCPHCAHRFEILWGCIQWPDGEPEKACCHCPGCGAAIDERSKPAMVEGGCWRATRPNTHGHAGFRLNALVSLLANARWGQLAREFVAAKDDPDELRVFVNTVLAEPWRGLGGEIDETSLAARAEAFDLNAIPEIVLAITCGVDVQDDRLEATIAGWTRDGSCLVLGHFVIWGRFTDTSTWDELDETLRSRWRHPFGGQLKVDAAVIDAGDGDHFDAVMNFCAPRLGRRIFAGKGASGARPGFAISKGSKRLGGRLAIIGADTLKGSIFDRLQRPGSIRFSHTLERVYFEQLASERRVIRYRRGQPVRRFERVSSRVRAEALDALVYAFAARSAVPINFDRREDELRAVATAAPSVVRSRFMDR
jgi:phage terminase large subunit GpA-like protein